uniref:Reverse transcriptase domain-containing protein n=1 Tax=Amphimedon queenslandica TaxID=400682 RepID=A0A1X7V5R9_AMPQE
MSPSLATLLATPLANLGPSKTATLVLSSALPPILGKVVEAIRAGACVLQGPAARHCGLETAHRRHWTANVISQPITPPRQDNYAVLSAPVGGKYQYTEDVLALEAVPTSPLVEGVLVTGVFPLAKWDRYLYSHSDREFADFLRRGIHGGFKIGSIYHGIDDGLTSLCYPRFEVAVELIKAAGRGALMAKLDLKAAYRHVPVHPDDQLLLAVRWGRALYIDTALLFGLCSAQKLFTAMADGLAWGMIYERISHFLHYLDDFFFCPPQSSTCERSLRVNVRLCEDLRFPVSPEKVV